MKKVPVLLIGGVGRSGTNLLKDILSLHNKVFSLPFESRFTIDPDGVIPTYALLREVWSPFISEKAIERLNIFLNKLSQKNFLDKIAIYSSILFAKVGFEGNFKQYKEWELKKSFPNFKAHNNKLINDLKLLEYEGTWAGRKGSFTKKALNYVGYSNKNNELDLIFNEYFYKMYQDLLTSKKKSLYVEDNTFNILYAKYYEQLLPGSFMVHMIRDPRDVVASYIKQRWCPNDIKVAVKYYVELMERWFKIKKNLNINFYSEIKLEDLCKNTNLVLNKLSNRLNIEFDKNFLNHDLSKSNTGRWIKDFDKNDQKFLNKELIIYINHYGYQ